MILFYCTSPPTCGGGQTPICDMRKVYTDMEDHRDLLGNILQEGVRYCRSLPSSRSSRGALYNWEKTFTTENKEEVERLLASLGYEVEWKEEDLLHYW